MHMPGPGWLAIALLFPDASLPLPLPVDFVYLQAPRSSPSTSRCASAEGSSARCCTAAALYVGAALATLLALQTGCMGCSVPLACGANVGPHTSAALHFPPRSSPQAPGIDFDYSKAAALAQAARDRGMLAGIALTPDTQPEAVFPLCEAGAVDTVLLLAVRAGFGGQVGRLGVGWSTGALWWSQAGGQAGTQFGDALHPVELKSLRPARPLSQAPAACVSLHVRRSLGPRCCPRCRRCARASPASTSLWMEASRWRQVFPLLAALSVPLGMPQRHACLRCPVQHHPGCSVQPYWHSHTGIGFVGQQLDCLLSPTYILPHCLLAPNCPPATECCAGGGGGRQRAGGGHRRICGQGAARGALPSCCLVCKP